MATVVGIHISSTIKLSYAIEHFETFGDVIKGSMDARRRQNCEKINVFITYADKVSAKRALEAGYIIINGEKIAIEEESNRKRRTEENEEEKKEGRFQIESKIMKISSIYKKDRIEASNNSKLTRYHHDTNKQVRPERKRSPAIKSFIRRNAEKPKH